MDLVYLDENMEEVGIIQDHTFDLAFGEDENDFCLTLPLSKNVCEENFWLCIDGTEYGGIIDKIEVITAENIVNYYGRTFHGILASKVLIPPENSDYLYGWGELNAIMRSLLTRVNLNSIFQASSVNSGIRVSNYQFYRYIDCYSGIKKMLASAGAKLKIELVNNKPVLSAVPIVTYDDEELDSDHVNFRIKKNFNSVNHLICLGSGELKDRTVINLYTDNNGNISQTQYYTGMDEVTAVFDYPNVESESELEKYGTDRLKELHENDAIEINLDDAYSFDIGDVITVSDINTGISITKSIVKKIVSINKDYFQINYEVGEI